MLPCFAPESQSAAAIPIHAVSTAGVPALLATLGAEAWAAANGFPGKLKELPVPDGRGGVAAVLLDLGRPGPARSPFLAGTLAARLPAGTYRIAAAEDDAALVHLGWALSAYRFERYRKPATGLPLLVLPDALAAVDRTAAAVWRGRDLVNTPANDLGPAEIAAATRALAETNGAMFRETVGDALLTAGYPLIHAVGAGSDRAPRLADFTVGDPAAPKVTIVGKGVAFDTGGLNIKPESGMLLMKKDMGGAATALALAELVLAARLDVRMRVLVPAVENAISGRAFRPGDVYPSRRGLTVEIGNTDAEGRLILADALAEADAEAPDLLIDFATLTGAARVALGPELPAVFTRDDAFAADLAAAGADVADPSWRLPLWPAYDAMLDSKIADVNHISGGPFAGAITAALFLGRFVEKAKTWVHADVFAWNPSTRPGRPEGGEIMVARALMRVLEQRYG